MAGQKEIKVSLGDHKFTVLVGESATSGEAALAIVEAINNDSDCHCCVFIDDDGAICQSPVETMVFRAEPMETLDTFKIRHGLADKKGRRRGQRNRNFPR